MGVGGLLGPVDRGQQGLLHLMHRTNQHVRKLWPGPEIQRRQHSPRDAAPNAFNGAEAEQQLKHLQI